MSADRSETICPLVLIAGQLMTPQVWEPVMTFFPSHAEVRCADISQDDNIGMMAKRLLATMPERFDLAGFAMGGFVAFEVMRQAPDRVRSLILMSTLAEADTDLQRERRGRYSILVEAGNFDHVVKERIPILLGRRARENGTIVSTIKDMALATGAAVFLQQQRAILDRIDSRLSLSAIQCPTLILRGEEDAITSAEHQGLMTRSVAHAKGMTLAACGHVMPLEAPETVARVMVDWLDGGEVDGKRPD